MKRKGIFLVFALWLFILLAFFCAGLSFRTRLEIKRTKLFLNRSRTYQLAVSGIKLAGAALLNSDKKVTHSGQEWTKLNLSEVVEEFSATGRPAKLEVIIEDESARINVNKIELPSQPGIVIRRNLELLFEQKAINEVQNKLNYLRDYIDQDLESCVPDLPFSEEGKNGELATLEELLLVKDFFPEDYDKLKEELTFLGEQKININTAKAELLETLISEPNLIAEVLELRSGEEQEKGYYGEGGIALPDELKDYFKTSSSLFRIVSKAEIKGVEEKITCIVDANEGKIVYRYWYEE